MPQSGTESAKLWKVVGDSIGENEYVDLMQILQFVMNSHMHA
jgi:hypothetical protein